MSETKFEGWAVLELLGHRRIGGFVREVSLAGSGMLRIDIPRGAGTLTQFYPPTTLYCMTPSSEEVARAAAAASSPEPVHAYEIPRLPARRVEECDGEHKPPACSDPECWFNDPAEEGIEPEGDPDRLHKFELDEGCDPPACGVCGEDEPHAMHRRHDFERDDEADATCSLCELPAANEIHTLDASDAESPAEAGARA